FMKNKKTAQIISIIAALVLSVFIAYMGEKDAHQNLSVLAEVEQEASIIEQKATDNLSTPVKRHKLYNKNELIGIIHDYEFIKVLLGDVYAKEYQAVFPDTELGFIDDLYVVDHLSYNDYEDKDQEIFDYVYENELIAISVPKVEFSNGATIFVKDISDFNRARETFIKSYVSDKSYEKLKNNQKIDPLKNYGEQDINLEIEESII